MRRFLIVVLALTLCAGLACQNRDEVVTEEPLEPKPQPRENNAALTKGAEVPLVVPGDKVVLELTVFHPPVVYLTGEVPVSVLAPADRGFEFEQTRVDLTQPRFPLSIPFTVTNENKGGAKTLYLGLRVNYAFKADGDTHQKNVLLEVPLEIDSRIRRPRTTLRVPIEHFLKIQEDIVEEEVQ